MKRPTRSRAALAILLLAAAAALAIGVAIERSQPHDAHHEAAPTAQPSAEGGRGETTTEGEGGEATTPSDEQATGTNDHPGEAPGQDPGGEQVFGINTESTALVILVLITSVALAAAIWLTQLRWLLVLIAGFAAAATVFDLREALHQADESHTLLITIALIVAALHGAAALIAVGLARRSATANP